MVSSLVVLPYASSVETPQAREGEKPRLLCG